MTPPRHYLDWNASAQLRPEARDAMLDALASAGNPSSVHAEGRHARARIESARRAVADLVGADADAVYFTSGATEANAWVLAGAWRTMRLAGTEHDSIAAPSERSGAKLQLLPLSRDGRVDAARIAFGEVPADGDDLLILQAANNETGILQPVPDVATKARAAGWRVLTDAAQAAGRIPVAFAEWNVDYMTLSAHKLGGPQGVGALVVRDGAPLQALLAGGGQERRMRAGTENVAAIAGFGAAARAAAGDLTGAARHMARLRDGLERELANATPSAIVIGAGAPRLPNTTCIALPGRQAAILVAALDLAGIAVSAGAACSSGKVGASRTLAAMGLAPAVAEAAIRISIGPTTTAADIEAFVGAWRQIVAAGRRAA